MENLFFRLRLGLILKSSIFGESHDLMGKYLKKIDFTDRSVYPEFNLSTAHLKVDLTKNPI